MDPDTPGLDELLVLRPLFGTSFLLAELLAADDGTVVLSSASAKTSYGLAALLDGPVVGLTSERNRAFVESLGVYDRVLGYDDVAALASVGPVTYVDVSGDRDVREAVRRATGEALRRDVTVGATHWSAMGDDLGDGRSEVFFAPSHLERLGASLGPQELGRRMTAAWDTLTGRVGGRLDVERSSGPEALERVWLSLLDGDVDPSRAHVVSLT